MISFIKNIILNIKWYITFNIHSKFPLGYIEYKEDNKFVYFYSKQELSYLLRQSTYDNGTPIVIRTISSIPNIDEFEEIIKKYYMISIGCSYISPKDDKLQKFYQDFINKRNKYITEHEKEMIESLKKFVTVSEGTKIKRLQFKENEYILRKYSRYA